METGTGTLDRGLETSGHNIGVSLVTPAKRGLSSGGRRHLSGRGSEVQTHERPARGVRSVLPNPRPLAVEPLTPALDLRAFGRSFRYTVVSNGASPIGWRTHFEDRGYGFQKHTKGLFEVPGLAEPTIGVEYSLRVIPGAEIFGKGERTSRVVLDYFSKVGFGVLPVEAACLTFDVFTTEILVKSLGATRLYPMHDPIVDHGVGHYLGLNCCAVKIAIGSHCDGLHHEYPQCSAFVGLVSRNRRRSGGVPR